MAIPISNVPRRVVFAASGTGPYAFTFEILAESDIAVYRDDTLLTITTDYTVTINSNGTGSVTLNTSPVGATQIAIVGNRTIARSTDFTTGGDFFANTLNDELDQQTIFAQQNAEGLARALQAPQTDPTTINMTLPRAADRAGKFLSFDSSGNPVPGAVPPELASVNAIAADITAVAGISTNVTAVAGNATNINTVAGISGNVTTVAGVAANVTTVAGIAADVTAVAGDATDIGTVAADLAGADTIGTVAANITNVNAVAAIDSEVTAVAGDATNIGLVASQVSPTNNILAVAGQATNIAALGPIAADITTVAGDSADIQSLATKTVQIQVIGDDLAGTGFNYDLGLVTDPAVGPGASPDGYLVTVYDNLADITIVANNVADITNFADVYQGPKSSDPALRNDGSALQAGDLYFNTNDSLMKVYDGSIWIGAYAGLGDLAYLDTVDTAQIEDGAITSDKLDSTLDLGAIA